VWCLDRNPDEFAGYEIDLFRRAVTHAGLSRADYTLTCLDWNETLDHIGRDDGEARRRRLH
jgi:hypothetical protein